MRITILGRQGAERGAESLGPIIETLEARQPDLRALPVSTLVALFDDYSRRLLEDGRTRGLDGVMFLSAWLKRSNLVKILDLNLNGKSEYLDGFVQRGRSYLAAKPHGLVAMWMAGNVGTLPIFSLVPALLTKNVCLMKLAADNRDVAGRLLDVLAISETDGLSGADLLEAVSVVWFDHGDREISADMSMAADAKVMWGGEAAVQGITSLPRREHCVEIVFGPKYSIGIIDRELLAQGDEKVNGVISAFVRDAAVFDQRACSAPQTIFVERSPHYGLREVGELFAAHFRRLPAKIDLDAYTTMQILNARAEWALDESRDVISSRNGANWTVCMDGEVRLKDAVQSRTVFLTEIDAWTDIIPLISHKVQTVGIAFGYAGTAREFAEAVTAAGAVRCVRPGLINLYESPWDGKLFLSELVRWVSLKP